jgi:glycosyltransferase involved in cell wall biosynthesis
MAIVSVLIPFHGAAKFLSESVRSVLGQTMSEFELLLIDDRADAEAKKMSRQLAQIDSRIRIVQTRHPGLPFALNTGITASRGKYLARLDDDDKMCPERLEVQLKVMAGRPDLVCLGSQVTYFDAEGKIGISRLPRSDWQIRNEAVISNPMAHPSLLMRKSSVIEAGLYNESFTLSEDYELVARLMRVGKLENSKAALTHYRIHAEQISSARKLELHPYVLAALEFINHPNKDPSVKSQNVGRYIDSDNPEAFFLDQFGSKAHVAKSILSWRSAIESNSLSHKLLSSVKATLNSPLISCKYIISKVLTATSSSPSILKRGN